MNTRDIQRRLMVDRYRRSFVVPNYTPFNWWECDVMEITDAGYMREYEIKISRSDFFADASKSTRALRFSPEIPQLNKHQQLVDKSERGPRQFWFVVPHELISLA